MGFGVKGKTPKAGVDLDISSPEIDVDKPTLNLDSNFDVSTPTLDVSTPHVNLEGSIPKLDANLKTPKKKFKGPACLQGEKPDPHLLKLRDPKVEGEVKSPKVKMSKSLKGDGDVDLPNSEIHASTPGINATGDLSADAKKPKFSGFSCLDGEKPDPYLLKLQGPKPDLELKVPKSKSPKCLQGEIELEKPKADISIPEKQIGSVDMSSDAQVELDKSKGKFDFQLPEAKLPSADFNINMPSLKKSEGKVETTSGNLNNEFELPALEVKDANLDLASPDISMEGKKTKSKGFSCLGDASTEAPDPYLLRLKGPKAEVKDTELTHEGGNIHIDVSVPKSDANLSAPKIKKKAKFTGPSCLQGDKPDPHLSKLQGPKVEKVEIEKPKVEGFACFKGGKSSVDVEKTGPSLSANKELDDINIGTATEIELKEPAKVDAKKKFKGPSCLQGEKPDPHLPKLQGPKAEIIEPHADVSISGEPKKDLTVTTDLKKDATTEVEAKSKKKFQGPSCLKGEKPDPQLLKLQGPKVEIDPQSPDVSVTAAPNEVKAKSKFRGPSCLQGEKPDPHLLKLQGPKAEVNADVKSPEIVIGKPVIDVNIEKPSSDVGIQMELPVTEPVLKLEESEGLKADVIIDDKPKKSKFTGPACLKGEKPDPYLLQLKGPKVEVEKKPLPDLKKQGKISGPSCLRGEKADPELQEPKPEIVTGESELKASTSSLNFVAPDINIKLDKPKKSEISKTSQEDTKLALQSDLKVDVEEGGVEAKVKPKKMQGLSCLAGEKPDPYLLKLQGPKTEKKIGADPKKSSLKRPSCLKGEADQDISISAKAPKMETEVSTPAVSEVVAEIPTKDVSLEASQVNASMNVDTSVDVDKNLTTAAKSKKDKSKSTSCWKGSESPDPYLLKLQGPKLESNAERQTGSLKVEPQLSSSSTTKSSSLPSGKGAAQLEASEVGIKVSKKQKGPSCLKGEVEDPAVGSISIPSKDLSLDKPVDAKKFKVPKFHISNDQKGDLNQATLTPVLGPEGRTTFAIMESPDIDFVTPKLQVTPKLPKASLSLNKEDEKEAGPTNTSSGFNFKGFHMKKSKVKGSETETHVAQSDQPSKRSPFKMPKVSITAKKKQSYSVSAFPDVDVQFPYIDSSEPQVSVEAPGTPPHLTLQAMRRLGSTDDENEEMSGSKTLPPSRRGQRESVTTSWPKIRSSGGSLGDDVDSAGASPESTLKPRSPSLHGSNVSIKYYFVDTPFSATEIEIPDVSADPHSQLKLTETSSGIIVMETTHTSVSPHGGDSSALDVDAAVRGSQNSLDTAVDISLIPTVVPGTFNFS